MLHIYIDGKRLAAQEGETILAVAKRNGFYIPTLCHHEALEDVGACRLCMVEITHKDWSGWKGLVTSCLYQVEDNLEVFSFSEPVKRSRQATLDLLMARCPDSDVIRDLSEENGGVSTQYKQFTDGSKCIMCSLCVRACDKMECSAIGTVNRGISKEISTPFHERADACIGCGSCAAICPTGHIEMIDTKTEREIWGKKFKFVACDECGEPVMTEAYKTFAIEHRELPEDYYTTCSACKKKKLSVHFSKVGS